MSVTMCAILGMASTMATLCLWVSVLGISVAIDDPNRVRARETIQTSIAAATTGCFCLGFVLIYLICK